MALAEGFNLSCPFAGQEGAYSIDEAAAGLHQLRSKIEQPRLHRNQAIEPLGREPPAAFRIAAPRSASRAGRIDKHQIRLAAPFVEVVQLARRVQQLRLD